ncbi:MAG TPA: hypothetical protein VMZ52_13845 [Bryobacteraceae bacterium]|nr:hypothetical protein [Bryobacteraceae bacterium]
MKVKKAIRRLDKVQELLSNVFDQYDGADSSTKDLLSVARKSVVRAKSTLKRQASSKAVKKSPVKARKNHPSVGAKERPDGLKRTEPLNESSPPVSQTA